VWSALDVHGARYALKLGSSALLAREYAVVAACAHPHVVTAVEWLTTDSVSAIVFEYLSGGDLVSLAGTHPRHWLTPLADLVDALAHVHALGFVHRDVKARNVLLDESSRAKLIDFGSAEKIGSAWTVAGTTAEARRPDRGADPVTPGDDVYALGALLHELLYGHPPALRAEAPRVPPEAMPLARLAAASLASPAPPPAAAKARENAVAAAAKASESAAPAAADASENAAPTAAGTGELAAFADGIKSLQQHYGIAQ
jgi:serine/threonine protein kinase